MKKYDHRKIEKRWQREWEKSSIYRAREKGRSSAGGGSSSGGKSYVLDMFPYPSGEGLHVGHPKGYIATDIYSRYQRMHGRAVLHPMGWDAFGLPAENYAIQHKVHPKVAVRRNIARFKKQLSAIGLDYDWRREINTTDPGYYKWTQWIFLKLLEKGLAYESHEPINWCPTCQTGLSNEDLDGNACERCGSIVEKRPMRQWMLRITEYADRLLKDLSLLPEWQEHIKESQRNWIGRSEGAEIDFPLEFVNNDGPKPNYLLLHGYKSSAVGAFIPWLKSELESRGFTVQVPELPDPNYPKEREQVQKVLESCKIDERTIIVGHSLGGGIALKVLEKLNKPIAGLVLIGSVVNAKFPGAEKKPFWKDFSWDIDYERIKKLARFTTVISDLQEGTPRVPYLKYLAEKLSAQFIECKAREVHFRGKEEPMVLAALLPRITVFTTRPDTLFGATFMVLSPEHPWVQLAVREDHKGVLKNQAEVRAYVAKAAQKTEIERQVNKEKTGVKLDGVEAINPTNGEKIPLFVADYVLATYGTGAIMAVPAHDHRDYEFAKKFGLPIREVISGGEVSKEAYVGDGLLVNSGEYDGISATDAVQKMGAAFGSIKTTYKLRDWVFSRQRYWGEPIPVIHCAKCGVVSVPEKDLPVKLPEVRSYQPTGTGESPLANITKWVNTRCPRCKGPAKRETNTMPQWAGSSWYYLRYMDPRNSKALVNKKKERYWAPVDTYVGGAEHATRHLIYARFWHKFLHDIGVVSTPEPFMRLISVGLILAEDGKKMSKRYGNVINPDDIVRTYGADTLRMYEMFMGPFTDSIAWSTQSMIGARRFLERVWRLGQRTEKGEQQTVEITERELHKTIKKVGDDIKAFKFNTAIAAMMTFLNVVDKTGWNTGQRERFLKILAPFAPHLAEELWFSSAHASKDKRASGNPSSPRLRRAGKKSIHLEPWPTYDASMLKDDIVRIAVQINGKTRGEAAVAADADNAAFEAAAREAVAERLTGAKILRTIVVPGRLVNFVVEP